MIASTVTSILGVFRNTYGKPEVIARSVDNQKLKEISLFILTTSWFILIFSV